MQKERPARPEKGEKISVANWFRNYWYYYRIPVIIALIAVIVVVGIIYIFRYQEADMRVYVVTDELISNEDYSLLYDRFTDYTDDVDGDNNKTMTLTVLCTEGDGSSSAKQVHDKLQNIAESNDTLFFLVDDAGLEAVQSVCELRELAYFTEGVDEVKIVSDDPYKLRINGSNLLAGTAMDTGRDWYIVMKYIDDAMYKDYYMSIKTDLVVTVILNNDLSEENDVEY